MTGKPPLTRAARAGILIARRKGLSFREIREACDVSHGSIHNVLRWAEENPDQAAEEIAAVYGEGADEDLDLIPRELYGHWCEAIRRTLAKTMELLDEVAANGATVREVRQDYDADGDPAGRRVTVRRGTGEDVYKIAGLLKILAEAAPKVRALLEADRPAAPAPATVINVTQSVGDEVTIHEVERAEDRLVSLEPDDRRRLLDLLGDDETFEGGADAGDE